MTEFNRFFAPRSLAFMGASGDTNKWGYRILANIVHGGFPGKIYPVNPKGGEALGLQFYRRLEEVPEVPDLVVIVVPPVAMIDTIKGCISKGIKAGVVVTAGFAEVNESGAAMQDEIVTLAREGGMRLIGPNCFGILSPSAKLYAQMPPIFPPEGRIAVVSQSGNVGLTIARRAMALDFGCSRMISIGNEADLHAEDFMEYLADDDKTAVILAYIEGFKDGRRFFQVSRDTSFKKPIVMIKVGETEAGASAARSHTAALSGSAEVFGGISRQAGIIRANNLLELMNLGYGFLCHPIPKGRRVAIATLGGGWGVLAADACARLGLDVVKLPKEVINELDSFLPAWWSRNNPVDLVAGSADAIIRVVDGSHQGHPQLTDPEYSLGDTLIIVHDIVFLEVSVLAEHIVGPHGEGVRLCEDTAAFTKPFDEVRPGIETQRIDEITPFLGEPVEVQTRQPYQVNSIGQVGIGRPCYNVHAVAQLLQRTTEVPDVNTLSAGKLISPVAQ